MTVSFLLKSLLEKFLIPNASQAESKVFYLKMNRDYYGYVAEVSVGVYRWGIVDQSPQAYQQTLKSAERKCQWTHPIRWSLVLNFLVFHYEVWTLLSKPALLRRKHEMRLLLTLKYWARGHTKTLGFVCMTKRQFDLADRHWIPKKTSTRKGEETN